MDEEFTIDLADYVFEPEECNILLREWQSIPTPKTINELARMYLAHRVKDKTGFLPFDRRTSYRVNDKIVVRSKGQIQPQLAKVTKVSKSAHEDSDGVKYDIITVQLLSQAALLPEYEIKDFIANYHGEELAGPRV